MVFIPNTQLILDTSIRKYNVIILWELKSYKTQIEKIDTCLVTL